MATTTEEHAARRREMIASGAAISVTVKEVVEATGLGRTSVFAAIRCGALPSRKVAGRRIILMADLEAWIRGTVAAA